MNNKKEFDKKVTELKNATETIKERVARVTHGLNQATNLLNLNVKEVKRVASTLQPLGEVVSELQKEVDGLAQYSKAEVVHYDGREVNLEEIDLEEDDYEEDTTEEEIRDTVSTDGGGARIRVYPPEKTLVYMAEHIGQGVETDDLAVYEAVRDKNGHTGFRQEGYYVDPMETYANRDKRLKEASKVEEVEEVELEVTIIRPKSKSKPKSKPKAKKKQNSKTKSTITEFKNDTEKGIVTDYINGAGTSAIARTYNVSMGTIYTALNRHKIPKRNIANNSVEVQMVPVINNKKLLNAIIDSYNKGVPVKDIYEKYSIHKNGLYYLLDYVGVDRKVRHKGKKGDVELKMD
uniref:Transposase domain-containing protein n=1 Tax=Listeria phage LMTA-34 TaxID=1486397 RepID=A0A076G7I3_9CAUD|nr:transposase domain-containing protein [Listeria phage LMTA-34]